MYSARPIHLFNFRCWQKLRNVEYSTCGCGRVEGCKSLPASNSLSSCREMAISSSCWLCNLQGVRLLDQCPKKKKENHNENVSSGQAWNCYWIKRKIEMMKKSLTCPESRDWTVCWWSWVGTSGCTERRPAAGWCHEAETEIHQIKFLFCNGSFREEVLQWRGHFAMTSNQFIDMWQFLYHW